MKGLPSLLLFVLAFAFLTHASAQPKIAPNFALNTADGKTFELNKYRGKVVVVNFWATWCKPCTHEIPDFIKLHSKYKEQGVQFVGISVDEDGWTSVKPFIKESGMNYPVVLGDAGLVQKYGGFDGIPTTFVIDGSGKIIFQQTGMMTMAQLESKIKPLLKKRT